MLNVYSMRMAAVFTLTTVNIARRTGFLPRWLWLTGLVTALVLLIVVSISAWVELLFPLWILVLSIEFLRRRPTSGRPATASPPGSEPAGTEPA